MWNIIDTETWTRVASFPDDQYAEALKKLAQLRKSRGNHFKLLDH